MAGESGWPTRAQIALAARAVAEAVPGAKKHDLCEVACKWETGETTIEHLYKAAQTAITAYAHAAAHAKIAEYAAYKGDGSAFATNAAATAQERAWEETADIVRRMLNGPYPRMHDLTAQRGRDNSGFPSESRELSDIAHAVLRSKRNRHEALFKQRQKGPNSAELIASATMNASDEMSSEFENATRTLVELCSTGGKQG